MSNELFRLINWIKNQQKKEIEHKERMSIKNSVDDEFFTKMLATLVKLKLPQKEMLLVMNFLRHKSESKNFTPGQRSAISNLFYKKSA